MESVILQGPDALKAAVYLRDALGVPVYDLGPDFGEDTARVWMIVQTPKPVDWVERVNHWRDVLGWFDNVGKDFRAVFDGPPFAQGGIPSVDGTPL